MTFNKRELRTLLCALADAIDDREALVDAHRCSWSKKRGDHRQVVPAEDRPYIRSVNGQIQRYRRLQGKIRQLLDGERTT